MGTIVSLMYYLFQRVAIYKCSTANQKAMIIATYIEGIKLMAPLDFGGGLMGGPLDSPTTQLARWTSEAVLFKAETIAPLEELHSVATAVPRLPASP